MEKFCEHVEVHLDAVNMAEEDEDEPEGELKPVWCSSHSLTRWLLEYGELQLISCIIVMTEGRN